MTSLFEQANALKAQGALAEAAKAYAKVPAKDPNRVQALNNLGNCLLGLERMEEAAASFRQALALRPDMAEVHYNLACACLRLNALAEAAQAYQAALTLRPDLAEAGLALSAVLVRMERWEEAAETLRPLIARRPDLLDARLRLGAILIRAKRPDEAITVYNQAVEAFPGSPKPLNSLSELLANLGRLGEAEAVFGRSLALDPTQADTHNNLGELFHRCGRLSEAAASFRKAISIEPDKAESNNNLAGCLLANQLAEEAAEAFARAVAAKPDFALALNGLAYSRKLICQWDGMEDIETQVREAVMAGAEGIAPFHFLTLASSTAAEQLVCATAEARNVRRPLTPFPHPRPAQAPQRRLRLGYLSADLHPHPSTYLLADLIENHDRNRFEVFAYSLGPADASPMRARLLRAFEHFADIRSLGPAAAAQRIHGDGIDILIDLQGFTFGAQPSILACRPAPILVNFLGYPGSLGPDLVDYIIGDPVLIPPGHDVFYGEKVVRLPDCYQPNGPRRDIATRIPSRAEAGLPEGALVFCCFNHSYKITRPVFDVWMRLLKAAPHSVLWLLDANGAVKRNLLREAAACGVGAERLVFAPRVSMADYLARFALADLFLDTLPYNAGATCSDALWTGLPVLTAAGGTYVGRMAASLVTAAGLSELVTSSLEEYEALALRLAHQPEQLAALRAKLLSSRDSAPLFDIRFYARALEAVYGRMWQGWLAGQPPCAITVCR